jgi:hypothetical protein
MQNGVKLIIRRRHSYKIFLLIINRIQRIWSKIINLSLFWKHYIYIFLFGTLRFLSTSSHSIISFSAINTPPPSCWITGKTTDFKRHQSQSLEIIKRLQKISLKKGLYETLRDHVEIQKTLLDFTRLSILHKPSWLNSLLLIPYPERFPLI